MATPIKRIEKEFFFKTLYDDKIPLIYLRDQEKYYLTLENPVKRAELALRSDKPIAGLKPRTEMELMFDFQGQAISCVIEVKEIDTVKDGIITAGVPEFLYKNLDRSYFRIAVPQDLQMRFSFHHDRYNLPFPKVNSFEDDAGEDLIKNPYQNVSALLEHLGAWVKGLDGNHKLVIFKDVKPSTTEARVVAETGKAFYLASTREPFPETAPFSSGDRVITAGLFKRYLESTGVDPEYLDDTCKRFTQAKLARGIFSDVWVPILFQEYIVGYIHVWSSNRSTPPFDTAVLDTLFKYARELVYSLKMNGFFENGRRRGNEVFVGRVIDISVSGLLFVYPKSSLFSSLLVNSQLLIRLITPGRTISINSRIVRRFHDSSLSYYGCHFLDTSFDDMHYLFEYLYGKTLGEDTIFQIGKM
jgi:hypothetical protein